MQTIMPERALFAMNLLNVSLEAQTSIDDLLGQVQDKWMINPSALVFAKIPQETVDELTQRFSGQI